MANQQPVKFINVIPNVKIKKEPIEDEEGVISCRFCGKKFMNSMALQNHAKMEHFEAYMSGEKLEADDETVAEPTEESRVFSLPAEDVSYIIVKQPGGLIQTLAGWTKPKEPKESKEPKERKRRSEKKPEPVQKAPVAKKDKDKEPEPITGPFECLQRSSQVADGTCHQIFFSCCEYSVHFRDEHTRRRKVGLRCQVCEKPLASGAEVMSPYPCEVCGTGFETSKSLSSHMATEHVKLKPFVCHVCNKRFTQQGGVQQHMRMHTGDRPFPCTFCSKAFTQKSGLDQHLRIHTKVKPYRCVICSKTFCQSVHLKQHMRTHTNVSPFQCGICSKRFKQSSHLNYHLRNHNPVNMSDKQKVEYQKLLDMMNKDEKVICVLDPVQHVEVEAGEVLEEMVDMDDVQILTDQTIETVEMEEQILAEKSIQEDQEEQEDDSYVLSDGQVWSVQMVEG